MEKLEKRDGRFDGVSFESVGGCRDDHANWTVPLMFAPARWMYWTDPTRFDDLASHLGGKIPDAVVLPFLTETLENDPSYHRLLERAAGLYVTVHGRFGGRDAGLAGLSLRSRLALLRDSATCGVVESEVDATLLSSVTGLIRVEEHERWRGVPQESTERLPTVMAVGPRQDSTPGGLLLRVREEGRSDVRWLDMPGSGYVDVQGDGRVSVMPIHGQATGERMACGRLMVNVTALNSSWSPLERAAVERWWSLLIEKECFSLSRLFPGSSARCTPNTLLDAASRVLTPAAAMLRVGPSLDEPSERGKSLRQLAARYRLY